MPTTLTSARWRVSLLLLLAVLSAGCSHQPEPDNGLVGPGADLTGSRTLPIAPSFQQTQVWCWATSAEMVFRYYNLPSVNEASYQCGIVAAWFGGQCLFNCGLCQFPVGPMSNMHQVLVRYGPFLNLNGVPSRSLIASLMFRALTAEEVKSEIDAGRPVVVGIAPGGGFALPNASQHIAVLIGYDFSPGRQDIIVNDPYPFDFVAAPNPYVAAGGARMNVGQFRVSMSALRNQLGWANTIYQIQ